MFKQPLFVSFDKQAIGITTALKLILIPIWNGNRTLDEDHVKEIENSIQSPQELNGTIIRIAVIKSDNQEELRYIVDGQHRATVIKNYYKNNPLAEDFEVLIAEKEFESEGEIVQFFKDMNRTKTIEWKEDPKMIANKYIEALLKEFQPITNKKKNSQYFKTEKTKKPYILIDKVRDLMIERHVTHWDITPEEYVKKVLQYNLTLLQKLFNKPNKSSSEERAMEIGFALAIDDNYLWI